MDQRHQAFAHKPITRNHFEVPSRTSTFVFMHSETPSIPPTLSSSPRETYTEARKFRRVPVEFSCLFSADGPNEWSGTVVNLSREGCAIRSTRPVQQGDDLRVLIFPCANQTPHRDGSGASAMGSECAVFRGIYDARLTRCDPITGPPHPHWCVAFCEGDTSWSF